jgi:hypothetical protein
MTAPIADTRSAGGASAADMAHEYRGHGGRSTPGEGWVLFAGVMIALAGCMNVINGIAAIDNAHVFSGRNDVVIHNLNTWGWIFLVLGAVQIFAAIGIWSGNELARWFGVAVAFVNAIGQLSFAGQYPIWSLTIVGLDVLVIYGLVAYGGRQFAEN